MILTYKELLNYFGSDYQIKKQICEGLIVKVKPGYYASGDYSPFELFVKKYNDKNIFTFLSSLYFQKLLNRQPDFFYIASEKDSTRIIDPLAKQIFMSKNKFYEGVDLLSFDGIQIKCFSKEKSLVIFLENRNKLSFDIYHEVILNYRLIIKTLNMKQLNYFINKSKNPKFLQKIIAREIL